MGLHHAAINVSDWDVSLRFYRDALGLQLLGSGDASGDLMERAIGRPGVRLRWAMLALGRQHLELIQYQEPAPGSVSGSATDAGATHIAIKVRDVDLAYRDLSARGVQFLGEPVRYDEQVPVGGAFAYALDPDGVVLEFIEDIADRP